MGVDAVYVLYGGAGDLPASVAAVRQQGDVVSRVLAVDNASPDGAGDIAESLGVDVIRAGANVGYAAAMNLAFRATSAEYLLTINADATLHAGYVERLQRALAADPQLAGATGVLLLEDGTVDSSGIEVTRAYWASDRDRGKAPATATAAPPFGASGAAALFRRAALEATGPDPWWDWLFTYWDDVEVAWRLRRHGWSFAVIPDAIAGHRRGADTADPDRIESLAFRNRLATVARHAGVRGLAAPQSAAVTAVTAARLAVRHPRALRAAAPIAAVRAGLAARRGDGPRPRLPAAAFSRHPWPVWLQRQLPTR